MVDLSSAKAKLGRAKLHMDTANRVLKDFVGSQFYTTRIEKDSKGWLIVKVIDLKPLPPEFALAVGDAAHNLRSALDHIIFSFSTKPLTSKEERRIQFPLISKGKEYRQHRERCLSKVPATVRALVDSFQPYHRKKWPANRILEQLQAINNWDKHRALAITATLVKRATLGLEVIRGHLEISRQIIHSGPMKDGTILARFEVAKCSPDTEVKMNGKIVVVPVFYAGMPKEIFKLSVMNRLDKIRRFIENDLLPKFEALR